MTTEETALMTQLADGPVAEADLTDPATAYNLVGRNVTRFYPMWDGTLMPDGITPARQCELTIVGRMYAEEAQQEQAPAQPEETPPPAQ